MAVNANVVIRWNCVWLFHRSFFMVFHTHPNRPQLCRIQWVWILLLQSADVDRNTLTLNRSQPCRTGQDRKEMMFALFRQRTIHSVWFKWLCESSLTTKGHWSLFFGFEPKKNTTERDIESFHRDYCSYVMMAAKKISRKNDVPYIFVCLANKDIRASNINYEWNKISIFNPHNKVCAILVRFCLGINSKSLRFHDHLSI